jgi:hypothetical protein
VSLLREGEVAVVNSKATSIAFREDRRQEAKLNSLELIRPLSTFAHREPARAFFLCEYRKLN